VREGTPASPTPPGRLFLLLKMGLLLVTASIWYNRKDMITAPGPKGDNMQRFALLIALTGVGFLSPGAFAIAPEDVYLVINTNVAASREIAEHYCQKRGVPRGHILGFDLSTNEEISRSSFEEQLAGPLRARLKGQREKVKVLLTVYGVPLRVGRTKPSAEDDEKRKKVDTVLERLRKRDKGLREKIDQLREMAKKDPKGKAAEELKDRQKEQTLLSGQIRGLQSQRRYLTHVDSVASVDSELAVLWHEQKEFRRWIPNVLYFQVSEEKRKESPPMIMTARLDGPDVGLIKRLVDQAVEVEKKGLQGKVYVDARGIKYNPKADRGLGYGGYDESLREMARLLEKQGKMTVVLDDKSALFAPGACPDCALYCGWYSLARFVDCCRFVPGAVAYHIASSEAVSLRNPKARFWCKNLLEKGAIVTLGPVAEPYTIGFPKPAEFYGLLVTGKYTVVECYWKTNMLASWMGVLVGDPLYNPYAKSPRLKVDEVKPSPEGGSVRGIFR
jgi:uncharacterized protein (TIGR03790 family)